MSGAQGDEHTIYLPCLQTDMDPDFHPVQDHFHYNPSGFMRF